MPGRFPNREIEQLEDNLASLSEIAECARILNARLQNAADLTEARRILAAVERIRTRERTRRANAQRAWK